MKTKALLSAIGITVGLAACSKPDTNSPAGVPATPVISAAPAAKLPAANLEKNAYFGAVHVHTSYSFDAFTNGTKTVPTDAYAWAQGEVITNSGFGPEIKIVTPLDFYAVSDHAEFMGVFNQMSDPNSPLSKLPIAARVTSVDRATTMQAFAEVLRDMSAGKRDPQLSDPAISRSVWSEIVKAADASYQPGKFTTFAAFEWTSNPNKRNLHRVVVFRDTKTLPDLVISSLDSDRPEDLWSWMETQREKGSTLFAIPHNANASDGLMFQLNKSNGEPIDAAYSAARAANEPLYEISQIKGTSETYPTLSPNDEFSGFEQWDYILSADSERPAQHKGSFVRQALLDGMSLQQQGMANPFKYGFIGDSDTHNAAASNEEFNYTGKFAAENNAKDRLEGFPGQAPAQVRQVQEFSSGGLAGVWAPENTREAIYDAMQHKETFGTSGPMIKVRLFGGWDFSADDVQQPNFATLGYARGVPMGSDLKPGTGSAPSFMVMAVSDPKSGNLDRIQIVKGWIDAQGAQQEKIYNVAWSGDRKPDADGKLAPVGNTVDVAAGNYTNTIGTSQLASAWTDPDFDPALQAFYYARVLEIPTPRWSTRDAAKTGLPIPEGLATSIQERAWSSPIWYTP